MSRLKLGSVALWIIEPLNMFEVDGSFITEKVLRVEAVMSNFPGKASILKIPPLPLKA